MTEEEREDVLAKIDNEGFDYAFINYSSFDEIKDEKFHDLRKRYVVAQNELEEYIGE